MATLLYSNPATRRSTSAFNNMLSEVLRDSLAATPQPSASFVPAADILETPTGFELSLALPGIRKADVKIEFLDGQLVVAGERPSPLAPHAEVAPDQEAAGEADKPAPAPRFRRIETSYGTFKRSFRLPDTVNVKAIAAEMNDGILRVTLPYDTEKTTKQLIEVR